MAATATDSAGTITPEPTSELLTKLQGDYKTAWAEMLKHADPLSKEAKDAKMAVWKIEGEINNEIAAIAKKANDAKIAELRNARLALNQTQLDKYAVVLQLRADKKADPAKLAQAETEFATAKEAVDNELLAKYASSSSAKKTVVTDGNPSTDGDAKKAAILELARAGKTQKEIIAEGYARSTVWHTINNAKMAGETFTAA